MSFNDEQIREYDETVEKFEKMDRIRKIKKITVTGLFACLLAAIVVYAVNIGHKLDKLNEANTIVVVKNETTTVEENEVATVTDDITYNESHTESEFVSDITQAESEAVETTSEKSLVIETTSDNIYSEVATAVSSSEAHTTTESDEIDAEKSDSDSQIYYVTKSGKKYHRAGCSYLKSKIEITIDKIKSGGYEPCSRCIG